MNEKVEGLRQAIYQVNDELLSWRSLPKGMDMETFQTLKSRVKKIQSDWQTQKGRFDTLLRSFPGVRGMSTLDGVTLQAASLETSLKSYFRTIPRRRPIEWPAPSFGYLL